LLLVASACVFPACRAPAPATEDVTIWRLRGGWTGRGLAQTEPFISETGFLRLTWDAHGQPGAAPGPGTFRITVHSDVSGRPLLVPVDRHGAGKDVTYVNEDPRSFFLVIESADLDWSVKVDEGIPAKRTLGK